ncbi:hypothetical protein, partial [Salana multivorans]
MFAASGAEVITLPKQLPTPVTAYTVRALECDAGSHGDGVQQPALAEMATRSTWADASPTRTATASRWCRPPTPRSPPGLPRSHR